MNFRDRTLPFFERTLVLLKPDAVVRGLIGEIIARFERAGLAVCGLKLLRPSLEQARSHYQTTRGQLEQMGRKTLAVYHELALDPQVDFGTADCLEIGQLIHQWSAEYLSAGPIVACVLEGAHAVKKVRNLCGQTIPKDASPGTIRGDFSSTSPAVAGVLGAAVYNLVHASDTTLDPREPEREITHWFLPEELVNCGSVNVHAMFDLRRHDER